MKLHDFLSGKSLSVDQFAEQLGGVSASGLRKWLTGERQPDADVVARIAAFTGGAVTADDMHQTRLAWLRANRPEKFHAGTEAAA